MRKFGEDTASDVDRDSYGVFLHPSSRSSKGACAASDHIAITVCEARGSVSTPFQTSSGDLLLFCLEGGFPSESTTKQWLPFFARGHWSLGVNTILGRLEVWRFVLATLSANLFDPESTDVFLKVKDLL